MCNELDSMPPVPVIAGAAISHEEFVLEAADGNKLAAFEALPDGEASAGIVVLPDVRGLYGFYEELSLRFAERGYAAVAIDYYGRTGGVAKDRPDDFPFFDLMGQTTVAGVQADVRAAVERLRGKGVEKIFAIGCCFGGTHAWLATAEVDGLAGAVGFHGGVQDRNGEPGPIKRAGDMKAPILALQGGADDHIPNEQNEEFDAALTRAGVEHEVVLEPGAPHSFFDRRREEFKEQSEDAWRRTLDFLKAHA
jgi:carboxymethylenebutenolidase